MLTAQELNIIENSKVVLADYEFNASQYELAGDFKTAQSWDTKAKKFMLGIYVLENCDSVTDDTKDCILATLSGEETAITKECEGTGIGYWSIERSITPCGIFKIKDGIGLPPYGEFTTDEFVNDEFTEQWT